MLSHAQCQSLLRQEDRTSEVEAHLLACRECRSYDEKLRALDALLMVDEDIAPSADFERRVLGQLRPRRRWMLWAAPALAGAFAALLVVALPRAPSEEDLFVADNAEMLAEMDMLHDLDAVEDFAVIAALEKPQ